MKKIAIFASGNGSNFEALVRYFKNVDFTLITDKKDARVIERAKRLNVKYYIVAFEDTLNFLNEHKFDLCVLAGYMRILPQSIINTGTFINIHPSLLPEFKGKDAIKRAFAAKKTQTGVTVHYVSAEIDSGEIIAQKTVEIKKGMTLEQLEDEIHKTEHELLPKVIENILKYNVLLVGSGAREHALAYKIKQSDRLDKLFLFEPNDGFKHLGEVIEAQNYTQLAEIATEKNIDLLIVGPELPLAQGIADIFKDRNIDVIGADSFWVQLESSKSFAKEFMKRNNIPTADYKVITQKGAEPKLPCVIKADGLAAGKGVTIAHAQEQAQKIIDEYLKGKFGEASKKIVIEEFLEGKEISLMCLWDGKTLLPFIPAHDFKKLNNKNTGGMGAICPVKVNKDQINEYLTLLKSALMRENADFRGIIYSGLIETKDGIKVLEYNMRLGDPETQALVMSMDFDLLDVFIKTAQQKLNTVKLKWKTTPSICTVLAAKGYPANPIVGDEIKIEPTESTIFFAGVKEKNNKFYSSSGRVLSVCHNAIQPDETVYNDIKKIHFENKVYLKITQEQL